MSSAISFQYFDGIQVVTSPDISVTNADARYTYTFTTGKVVGPNAYVAVMDQSSGVAQSLNISNIGLYQSAIAGTYIDTPSSVSPGGSGLIVIEVDPNSQQSPPSSTSTNGSIFLRHWTGVIVPQTATVASDMSDADLWDKFCSNPVISPAYISDILDATFSSSQTVYFSVTAKPGPGSTDTPIIKTYINAWDGTVADDPGVYTPLTTGNVTGRYFRAMVTMDSKYPGVITEFTMYLGSQSKTVNVNSFNVSAAGSILTFTDQFHSPPNIQVTPSDGTSTSGGASNITATQAIIQLFKGENPVGGTASITITGGGTQQGKLIISPPQTTPPPQPTDLVGSAGQGAVGRLISISGGGGSLKSVPYMIGYKSSGSQGHIGVEQWLGKPLQIVGATITTNAFLDQSDKGGFKDPNGNTSYVLDVSFPMLSVFGENNGLTDMNVAAAGGYDTFYQNMVNVLAASPNPVAVVNIGWEVNGNWYLWSPNYYAGGSNASVANYIATFKRIAKMVKKAMPHARVAVCYSWGVYVGNDGYDITKLFPGAYDAVNNPGGCDLLSLDFYQANITHYNNNDVRSTWAMARSGTGLTSGVTLTIDYMVAFARQQGLKVAFREYAAGDASDTSYGNTSSGSNDGAWTQGSLTYYDSIADILLYHIWSDDPPADVFTIPGVNAAEQAVWKTWYTNSKYTGTWWGGTPPRA